MCCPRSPFDKVSVPRTSSALLRELLPDFDTVGHEYRRLLPWTFSLGVLRAHAESTHVRAGFQHCGGLRQIVNLLHLPPTHRVRVLVDERSARPHLGAIHLHTELKVDPGTLLLLGKLCLPTGTASVEVLQVRPRCTRWRSNHAVGLQRVDGLHCLFPALCQAEAPSLAILPH